MRVVGGVGGAGGCKGAHGRSGDGGRVNFYFESKGKEVWRLFYD